MTGAGSSSPSQAHTPRGRAKPICEVLLGAMSTNSSPLRAPPLRATITRSRSIIELWIAMSAAAGVIAMVQLLLISLSQNAAAAAVDLQATEVFRSRVETAGLYCCPPDGAGKRVSFCNSTAAGCSGYYDFGSPQLLLSGNSTLLSFNQGERVAHQDDNNW